MSNSELVESIAQRLIQAEVERTELEAFTDDTPELDEALGYEVQDRTLEMRLARGEKLIGLKLGLTSKAKQERMSVETPIVGWLTTPHYLEAGERIPTEQFIHPRVEPEIFVTLKHDLEGPGVTPEQVLAAIDKVYAGLDVIDSRYANFRFRLGDVVADNASGAGFVVGPVGLDPSELDLALEAVIIEVDGQVVDTATGAAILGHPLKAIAEGVNILARRGKKLEAGQIVLAGALTDAIPLDAGRTIAFHFTNLGSIHLRGEAA